MSWIILSLVLFVGYFLYSRYFVSDLPWFNLSWGRPGEGKTLDQIRTCLQLFDVLDMSERRFPELPKRLVFQNSVLKKDIEDKNKDRLVYWSHYAQLRYCPRTGCWRGSGLHPLHDADIFIDEVGRICPADKWSDTAEWLRDMFALHRHRGLRIFANTQDYKGVDINFRRMTKHAWKIEKMFGSRDISASFPPPGFIFGLIIKRRFDPDLIEHIGVYDKDKLKLKEEVPWFQIPRFFFFTRKMVECYDTTQEIPRYSSNYFEEIKIECIHGKNCADHRSGFKIKHVLI